MLFSFFKNYISWCAEGTTVAQWLRYCATNQKVAGSIPDGVMEFFTDINPSDRTMALCVCFLHSIHQNSDLKSSIFCCRNLYY
jgi:hypothetical protein